MTINQLRVLRTIKRATPAAYFWIPYAIVCVLLVTWWAR
jgi:hypothetical protein